MTDQIASPNSKRALLDAFDEVLKAQQEPQNKVAPRRPTAVMWVAAILFLGTGGYVGIARPDWLFPPAPATESPVLREASLRLALANAARHVDWYRQKHGRLPATLQEAGMAPSAIVYERANDGYVLRGTNDSLQLAYRSTDSLRTFVGNSFETISRRRR